MKMDDSLDFEKGIISDEDIKSEEMEIEKNSVQVTQILRHRYYGQMENTILIIDY